MATSWPAGKPANIQQLAAYTHGNIKSTAYPQRSARQKTGVAVLRWLLLLPFIIGYWETASIFSYDEGRYLILSGVSLVACGFLLARLDQSTKVTLPYYITLGIFIVGYYVQFYLLAWDPRIYASYNLLASRAAMSLRVLMDTYTTTCLAFVTFCFIAWFAIGAKQKSRAGLPNKAPNELPRARVRKIVIALLPAVLVLEVGTALIVWRLNIAVMGADSAVLPFRLAGVFFYSRLVALPGLLLLFTWMAHRGQLKSQFRLGLALLLIHGIIDTVLRTSKGTLLILLLQLVFLLLLSDALNVWRLQFVAAGIVLVVLLFPVIARYRDVRAGSDISQIYDPLVQGFEGAYGSGEFQNVVSDTLTGIVFRVIGADGLLVIVESRMPSLGLLNASGVTNILNREIYVSNPANNGGSAPSLVGWFYLVGGNISVVIGMAAFLIVVNFIWRALAGLRSKPVAEAILLGLFLLLINDGVIDLLLWWFVIALATIAFSELLLRPARQRRIGVGRGPDSFSLPR